MTANTGNKPLKTNPITIYTLIYGFMKISFEINNLIINIEYGKCKINDDLIPGLITFLPFIPIPK